MAKKGVMDLTTGRPIKQILLFSLPLVMGTLFQQLYSFVDSVMVGRFISNDALGAVGATYSLDFLIRGFAQGACVGFGIPLAQSIGGKRADEFKRYYWNGCWLCLIMSVVLTAGTVASAEVLMRLMRTPDEIFVDATTYMKVAFLGLPAVILYNFCSGALRAAGDSKRPFYFLLFSTFLNIILDYIFIVPLSMGVAGAAWATVISQFVSGILNLYWLSRKTDLLTDSTGMRKVSASHIGQLCKLGFPMGFEYSVSAIGAVVMQGSINMLGTMAVTGQTTGEKIRQMFTLPMESVGMGMATYAGQNEGAGRPDRLRDGIKAGLTIQWTYCIFAWLVIFVGKQAFTGIVLGPDSGEAGVLSVQYLTLISTLFPIHGALMIMRNTLQGMGYSIHAVFSGVGELIGRSLGGLLAVGGLGFVMICYANPMAWFFALVYCSIMVFIFLRKRLKNYKE